MFQRVLIVLVLVAVSAAACAAGRNDSKLRMPSFSHLESKAVEAVDISFGRVPLRLAAWFIPDEDEESAQVKRLLKGMRSVSIRHFRFDSDFAYPQSDIEGIRKQLADKGWSSLVQVRDKRKDENVDIFVSTEDEKITGLAIVASEPREFTIVNIDGTLDAEQIEAWQAQFNGKKRDGKWGWGSGGSRWGSHDSAHERGSPSRRDGDSNDRQYYDATDILDAEPGFDVEREEIEPVSPTVTARL